MSKFILNDKATDDKINQILSIIKNNNHYLVRLKTKNRQNDIIILDKLSNIYYTY